MSEELESFEDIFEELQIELGDPEKIEEPIIKVPESEEEAFSFFDNEDEDEEEEPKKEEPAEEEDPEPEPNQDEDDEPSQYFKAVGEGLLKLGKFEDLPEDFKWTQESFLDLFEQVSEKSAQDKIEDILTDGWGEEGIRMFNDIFVKKVPVKEYLSAYSTAESYATMDMDKLSNQKAVVKAYLESLGTDEDEIYEQIELLEEREKLKERAEKYKEKLIDEQASYMDELSKKRDAAIKAQRENEKIRNTRISEVVSEALKTREINGIPVSTADTKELFKYVTAPAYKLKDGREITEMDKKLLELRNDPVKWVALGKLLKEDLNVTPIKNKAKDETAEEVFSFTKHKKVPSKSDVSSQLDLLFSRKKK